MRQTVMDGYDVSRDGLGVVRIVYAITFLLLAVPRGIWVSDLPAWFADPPPGLPAWLVQIFGGLPPHGYFIALNGIAITSGVFVLLGCYTRTASVVAGMSLLLLNAGVYSLGKINHDLLFVLMPVVLPWAGWGEAMSVDAARRAGTTPRIVPEPGWSWPICLFAMLVSCAMLMAAVPKATTGWLDPASQAVLGHTLANRYDGGLNAGLGPMALDAGLPWWWWEAQDWATVLLEGLLVVLVFAPRAFRVALGVAVLFHVSVFFTFGIFFWFNLVAYLTFAQWRVLMRSPLLADFSACLAAVLGRIRPSHVAAAAAIAALGLLAAGEPVLPLIVGAVVGPEHGLWTIGAVTCGLAGAVVGLSLVHQALAITFRRHRPNVEPPVLLYDGECGLCDRAVQFVIRRDLAGRFRYAALQGPTGRRYLEAAGLPLDYRDSIVLWQDGRASVKSGAALRVARQLHGAWAWAGLGLLVPAWIRDGVYDLIARHRFAWFGKADACRLPPPELRTRFLP